MSWKAALLVVAGLTLTGTTGAQSLEIIEGAYELTLADISFPSSSFGTLTFRDCANCAPTSLSVEAETTYATAQGQLPLPAFLSRVAELGNLGAAGATPVTVFYSLASGKVTRVEVHNKDN